MYDEKSGDPIVAPDGKHVRRPAGTLAPCFHKKPDGSSMCEKVGPWRSDLFRFNVRTYIHYQECKAVGSFPDDPIVRKNASIIRMLE